MTHVLIGFPRRLAILLFLAAMPRHPAAGFDSHWHQLCTQKAGEQFAFAESAWKIMQLGNFSPDFFGPVSEYASQKLVSQELDVLNKYQDDKSPVRGAAVFLHFDNLNGDVRGNASFDYLFRHLLDNTQKLLAGYSQLGVDDRVRKVLTLVTLGASLHAVQDFYSHSDWTHNDFSPSGGARAPTWLEYRSQHPDLSKWTIQVQSGIYPPVAGARNTHTHMNHDNSRLVYLEPENPGPPSRSQASYHNAGAAPARGDDDSNFAHQQFAVNTAIAASIEWIGKVEENPAARNAIEAAKGWNLKQRDPHLAKELEAGLLTEMALSCLAGKWDGDDPPGESGVICRSVLDRRASSLGGGTSRLESEIIGLAANVLMPYALKFTGMFWDVHGQYHILEKLAADIGSDSGRYNLPK
ncbi:MAG TPA: hypothetical protein VKR61_02900 [Bryobacteraceae bacterium]|nr:hypothetical protein [Bryobacteraceae bacterium]